MKLTKEECRFALKSFEPRTAKEHFKGGYYSFVKAYSILEQLINEHFDNIPLIEFERFVEASERFKNEPLKPTVGVYEVREIKKLEKALDKACEKLATVIYIEDCNGFCGHMPPYKNCMCDTKEFWKEYLLNENIR